jgi:nitrogen fixation protein FixH
MSTISEINSELLCQVTERRARRFWVSFICLILGSNIGMGLFAVYLAVSDPAQSVIPNYYQKGLDWDKTKAALAESERLGWTVEVSIYPEAFNASQRTIRLTVLNRDGNVVEKATGTLSIFHHAHAKEIQELSLAEVFPGVYEANAQMVDPGHWDMTLHLRQGGSGYLWQSVKDTKWTSASIEGPKS